MPSLLTKYRLQSTRRKRPIPEEWATGETISSFDSTETTGPLYPGSQTLAINIAGDLAILGGTDGVAGIYSISQKEIVHALKTGGSVNAAVWWGSKAVVATSTGAIKVFEGSTEVGNLGAHAGPATSLALHPCGDILASTGIDKSYKIYDLTKMKAVTQVYTDSGNNVKEICEIQNADGLLELLCGGFHPDGHLFGAGAQNGQIKLFNTVSSSSAADFDTEGPVQAFSFSENGTWLAVATKGSSSISIWDLRKGASIKTLDIGSPVENVKWEYTGQFLATAGPGCVTVQQYTKSSKSWSEPFRKAAAAKAVQWGTEAKSLISLMADGGLTIFSAAT
jgi:pre-mRNA-processing factor 19